MQWAVLYSKYCLNVIVFIIQRAAHASRSRMSEVMTPFSSLLSLNVTDGFAGSHHHMARTPLVSER